MEGQAMFSEIAEIKKIRKRLGLTQAQLAKLSGVSQSLIAKIESGRLNPTYTNAVGIFKALESVAKTTSLSASDVMNRRVVSARPDASLKSIISLMRRYGISQLPVVEGQRPIGLVTETGILRMVENAKRPISELAVHDAMEACPPVISSDSDLEVVTHLLKFFPVVFVSRNGLLEGLITKADILDKIARH